MNHIDAGTIHAWLDGALDAERSREIEAHVTTCSVCSAAVAEERGMIAGASRILLALDDVPAGVTPKRAPARAPVAPRRQWRAAPWVMGIAAALILAVGITTWRRADVQRAVTLPAAARLTADTPTTASTPGGTAAAVAQKIATKALQTENQASDERRTLTRPPAMRSSPRFPKTSPAPAPPPTAGAVAGSAGAGAPSPGVALAQPNVARQRRTASESRLDAAVVTSAPTTESAANRSERVRVEELAGCYAVKQLPAAKSMAEGVSAAADVAGRAATKRAASAPASTAARAEFAAAPPAIVRLDTAHKRGGYAVYAPTADSLIGFWNITGDSASAELAMRGTFPISQRNRVDCPER